MPMHETTPQPLPSALAAFGGWATLGNNHPLYAGIALDCGRQQQAPLSLTIAVADVQLDAIAGEFVGVCDGETVRGGTWGEVVEAFAERPLQRMLRTMLSRERREREECAQ
jgi:hypothetical protein